MHLIGRAMRASRRKKEKVGKKGRKKRGKRKKDPIAVPFVTRLRVRLKNIILRVIS